MKINTPVTQVEIPFPKGRYIVSRTDLKGLVTYANDTFIDISAVWHDFEAEDGGASFGDELDLSLSRKFGQYVTGLLKYADYNEDGFAVDTRKFWVKRETSTGRKKWRAWITWWAVTPTHSWTSRSGWWAPAAGRPR